MATKHTFKIRKVAGATPEEFTIDKPESTTDEAWSAMLNGDTAEKRDAQINELAFQQWKVKAQDAWRKAGTDPSDFEYGSRITTVTKSIVMDAGTFAWPQDKALAKEQYESLKRTGIVFTNEDKLPF